MTLLLSVQIDYLFFFCTLSFSALAAICFALSHEKREKGFPWHETGMFLVFQAAIQILNNITYVLGENYFWFFLSSALLYFSDYFIILFGLNGAKGLIDKKYNKNYIAAATALLMVIHRFSPGAITLSMQYLISIALGILSSYVLYLKAQKEPKALKIFLFISLVFVLIVAALTGLESPQALLIKGLAIISLGVLAWSYLSYIRRIEKLTSGVHIWPRLGVTLLVLFVFISGFFITNYFTQEISSSLIDDAKAKSSEVATNVGHLVNKADQVAKTISGSPWIWPVLSTPNTSNLDKANSVLDRYKESMAVSVCYLMDKKGLVIASSNRESPDSFLGKNYSFRPYFRYAIEGKKGRYSAIGVTSKIRGYYSAYPVKNPNGDILGAIVVKQNLSDAQLINLPFSVLVDKNGVILLSNPKELALRALWPISGAKKEEILLSRQYEDINFSEVLNSEPKDGQIIKYNKKSYIVFRLPVIDEDWSIVSLISPGVVLLTRLLIIFIVFFVSLLIITSFYIFEQREINLSLVFSEKERFETTILSIGDGVIVTDEKCGIKMMNSAAEKMTGWSIKEALGKPLNEVFKIVKEGSSVPQENPAYRAIATGKVVYLANHTVLIGKEDKEIIIADSAAPIHDRENVVIGSVLVFRDVTEITKTSEALNAKVEELDALQKALINVNEDLAADIKEKQKLAMIVETSQDAIYSKDINNVILSWNRGAENIYGYKREEALGKNINIVVPNEKTQELHEMAAKVFSGQSFNQFETKRKRKDGKIIDVSLTLSPVMDENGKIVGVSGIARDITDTKASQEEIKKLYTALKQAPMSIAITNVKGDIEYINPFFTKISGYAFEEAKGKNPRILQSGLTPPERYVELWGKVTKGEAWEGEFINKKKNGELYWEHAYISPVIDEHGKIVNYIGIKEDITEKKKTEEELKKLYKIKDEFISTVSHELRTPLTAIKEGIGIVIDRTAGEINPEQAEFLGIAKRNVDRLHRLINDVLDFQKFEAGKIKLNIKPNDIVLAVKEAVKTEEKLAEEKGLKILISVGENLPNISFDYDRILQVLNNYLTNAIKFIGKGDISVSLMKDFFNQGVKVCVEDAGQGIAREDIPKLFQRFGQLENKDKPKAPGTGLGLAISKQIIDQHKGHVWVESELGKGSKFWFTIPGEGVL